MAESKLLTLYVCYTKGIMSLQGYVYYSRYEQHNDYRYACL